MKKLLMIAYYFPPLGGVPVQRTLKFIKYLPEKEWHPVVLTVREGYDYFHPNDLSLADKVPRGISIVRAGEFGANAWLIRFLQHRNSANDGTSIGSKKLSTTNKTMWLRSLLYNSLWFPDEKNSWIPGAVFAGLRILSRENISVIYVSGFPWSAFLVGAILSKLRRVPLVLDFRDAWSLNQRGVWNNRFQRFWESKVLSQASKVIFATNLMRLGYIERYPRIDSSKFITITNGYNIEDFGRFKNAETDVNKKFLITFTGTFNDNVPPLAIDQSPYYFLKALSELLMEKDISQDIQVRFVGSFGESNKKFVEKLGLEKVVELAGYVTHDKSIEYQMKADLLLLIICRCRGSKYILTGKLFEYIGAKKPILALVPDGEARDLIITEKLGKVVWPEDVDGIKNTIYQLYNDWKQNKPVVASNDNVYRKYDMRVLTGKLADAIENLGEKQ